MALKKSQLGEVNKSMEYVVIFDGGGKIALIPNPVVAFDDDEIRLRNYEGGVYSYLSTPFFDEDW